MKSWVNWSCWVTIVGMTILTPSICSVAYGKQDLIEKAKSIHKRVITIDTHVDIPPNFGTSSYDILQTKRPGQQVDLMGMESGGLDAAFFIVFVPQGNRTDLGYAKAFRDAFTKFHAIRRMTDVQFPEKISLALTAEDVRRLHGEGKRAALIGIENGYAIGREIELLNIYHKLGARYLGILHNGHNDLGDSAIPNRRHREPLTEFGGLSDLGHLVVQRCNALGIMVDVSHSAMSTTLDVISLSETPVIASHSGVQSLQNHPRNLSDEALLALKNRGGLAQIVAFDSYLRKVPDEKQAAMQNLRAEMSLKSFSDFAKLTEAELATYYSRTAEIELQWPKASVRDLVDHIEYAVNLIGVDHVGISSDFNGGGGIMGWNNSGETLNVTIELVRRGYSEKQIEKLWGGNLLRVLEAVQRYASSH